MTEIELNGTIYRWELVGGGKGLVIENKYIKRPYCMITFENDELIKEPKEMVKRILGVLFAGRLTIEKVIKARDVVEDSKKKFEAEKNEIAAEGRYDGIVLHEHSKEEEERTCTYKGCGKLCKSKLGLLAHSRSHKLKTKKEISNG